MGIFDDIGDRGSRFSPEARDLWEKLHPEDAARMRRLELLEDAEPRLRAEIERAQAGGGERTALGEVADPSALSEDAFRLYQQLQPAHVAEWQADQARSDLWDDLEPRYRDEIARFQVGAEPGADVRVSDPSALSAEARQIYAQLQPEHVEEHAAQQARSDLWDDLEPRYRDEIARFQVGAEPGADVRVSDPSALSVEARQIYAQLQPEHVEEHAAQQARSDLWDDLEPRYRDEIARFQVGAEPGADVRVSDPSALSVEARQIYAQLQPEHVEEWGAERALVDLRNNAEPQLRTQLEELERLALTDGVDPAQPAPPPPPPPTPPAPVDEEAEARALIEAAARAGTLGTPDGAERVELDPAGPLDEISMMVVPIALEQSDEMTDPDGDGFAPRAIRLEATVFEDATGEVGEAAALAGAQPGLAALVTDELEVADEELVATAAAPAMAAMTAALADEAPPVDAVVEPVSGDDILGVAEPTFEPEPAALDDDLTAAPDLDRELLEPTGTDDDLLG